MPMVAIERDEGERIRKGDESKTQSNKEMESPGWKRRMEAPAQDPSVDTK